MILVAYHYFVAALFILLSGNALATAMPEPFTAALIGLVLLLGLNLVVTRAKLHTAEVAFLLGLAITILGVGAMNAPSFADIKQVLVILAAYMVWRSPNAPATRNALLNIGLSLGLLSIAGYAATYLLELKVPSLGFSSSNNTPYQTVFLFTWFDNHLVFRNIGIYWEPSVHAIALTIFCFMAIRQGKQSYLPVFVVNMITTISTTSLIGLFTVALFLLVSKKVKVGEAASFIFLFFLSAVAIFTYFYDYVDQYVISKFLYENISVDERVSNVLVLSEQWLQKPWGVGAQGALDVLGANELPVANTIAFWLAAHPIALLLCSLTLMLKMPRNGNALVGVGCFIVLASATSAVWNLLLMLFLFGALSDE